MRVLAYERFRKSYRTLPREIQRKIDRQLTFLSINPRHPSLQVKPIQGAKGLWEARVDRRYRMTFEMASDTIYLRVVGPHDEALSNP
jgi:mRNA-degrading endonuclease RelE of RelBE toxin-antitoxin system